MKYDDASWHWGGDFPKDLLNEAGATHIAMFLVWCILNELGGEEILDEEEEILATMEHNDIDRILATLRADFTKIDIEHGSPLIKMEKVHGGDTKITITCDVEDQHVYEEDEEEEGFLENAPKYYQPGIVP